MKTIFALVLFVLALTFCNLMGRRGNDNANTNSAPSPGSLAESSSTPADTTAPVTATPATVNQNTNERSRVQVIEPPPPPPENSNRALPRITQSAPPPASAPGAPTSSAPSMNSNSAASVPPRVPKTISGGVLNGRATSLPKPAYPPLAKAARASGTVTVQVTIDENGNVISASPVSGHPLLQGSATAAARQAKFSPTKLSGQPVKVTGVIIYNFVAQ